MVPPTYDRLAELPVPTSAYFVDPNVIQLNSSIQDFTRNVRRSVSKSIVITPDSTFTSPNQEISEIVLSRPSPSGECQAILREIGSGDQKRRFVEVWSKERILVSKEVTDVHGAFYNDDYFSTLSFTASSQAVMYVAEEKNTHPKDSPAYFRYSQSLGEGFPGKKRPAIFIFIWDLKSSPEKCAAVRVSTNSSIYFGQASFSSNPNIIFATGYEDTLGGRLLGIKGCYNRSSGIWKMELEENALNSVLDAEKPPSSIDCKLLKLTPPHLSCRSPRILLSENSERLFWLACATGGAHASTSSLHSLDLTTDVKPDNCKVVVDVVNDIREDGFPGLYPDSSLPPSTFLRIGNVDYLITHSAVTSYYAVTLVSLEDGTVTNLTPSQEGSLYSWVVLCTDGKRQVLCARNSPTVPTEIVLGEFDDSANVSWKVLQTCISQLPEEIQNKLKELKVRIVRIPGRYPVESVVIQNTAVKGEKPHILMPHGGPHATSIVKFDPIIVGFALEGFNISLPNYTGSLGFGESHVQNLLGKCGTLDVEDCIESLRYLSKNGLGEAGTSKVFLFGGSHGGYLTGLLLARYPDTFTAACVRNPVMSLGELSTGDIRDWHWAEFKFDYPLFSSPTGSDGLTPKKIQSDDIGLMRSELFVALNKLSPIADVEKVKAAVLLCIGGSDNRVSPMQGINYYHALKAARAKANLPDDDVDMLWFPDDGHPLEGMDASRMTWARTLEWFRDRL